jgi:hypothetical protein
MSRFVTGDRAPPTPERAEMLARVDGILGWSQIMQTKSADDPTLDRPVILLQDVIEVLHRSVLAVLQFSSRIPSSLSCTIAGG